LTLIVKPIFTLNFLLLFSASAVPLGAIFAALLAGFVLQKYGRKITLLISVAVVFVAYLILATSKIHEIPYVMIAARALMGITVGFSMPSATIYVTF
jgi:SP family galactose:H+ symporter-like MFS transporter